MSHDFFIPVLCTAPCHHNHCRKLSSLLGKSQCSGKVDAILLIPHNDLFTSVGERRLRLLRALGAAGFSLFQIQRNRHSLCKRSTDCLITIQFSFVRGMDNGYLDCQYRIIERSSLRLYAVSSLVGAVQCRHISSLSCLTDMEYNSQ